MVLACRSWFTVNHCFSIMSYDDLVNYLIFAWPRRTPVLFYRTNVIHMTTSLSRKLNIFPILGLCFLLKQSCSPMQLYVRHDILLTWTKQLPDRIISLKGNMRVHKTSLSPLLYKWSTWAKPRKGTVMYKCASQLEI